MGTPPLLWAAFAEFLSLCFGKGSGLWEQKSYPEHVALAPDPAAGAGSHQSHPATLHMREEPILVHQYLIFQAEQFWTAYGGKKEFKHVPLNAGNRAKGASDGEVQVMVKYMLPRIKQTNPLSK